MKLTFHGGVEGVTGSCHHLQTADTQFLVDCGMFQGGREADAKNYAPFAFRPRDIEFVLLTHAHIDHSGLLPRLVAEGFAGPIYATAATCDLLQVMLLDSAHIQQKEAQWRNEARKASRTRERKPIYTARDAERTLRQLKPVAYNQDFKPHQSVRCIYRDAGHILGSAIIEAWISEGSQTRKGVFSGDIGQPARPLVRDPAAVTEADFLLVEFVEDVEDSIALHQIKHGAIIISASGMCDAGRIKHHLRHNLGAKQNTLLITGFQAAGTLGRRIVDGEKAVRIFGVPVTVRADVYTIGGLSAHADQSGLLDWLAHFRRAPAHTFIVHGEPETAELFARAVRDKLHWNHVVVPQAHASVML